MTIRAVSLAAAWLAGAAAAADEGMWTFDRFPSERVESAYGFRPTAAWLEHVRLSSARLAQGCSGSFVSASGLVLTNEHCIRRCLQDVSAQGEDLVRDGFLARSPGEERRCPELEVNQLVRIADVTERMARATAGREGGAFAAAERAEIARIEKECQGTDALRCEVVTLWQGGHYDLYTYRRYQDVRLVFAPELAIAFFGGDPDNFNFPRFDLDAAFLRVHEGGKPVVTEHFFRWAASGPREGELVFVSGNPGGTSRQHTVAQLAYQRDVALPEALLRLAEWRGVLTEYARRGPEQARHSATRLLGAENALKGLRGRFGALVDRRFFAAREKAEADLRARLSADPERARRVLPALDAIAAAQERQRSIRKPYGALERASGFGGELFAHARRLVRAAEERPRPSEQRLREYRDSALPAMTQALFSTAPIPAELEVLQLGFGLGKLREELGPDDPVVRRVLGQEAPDELAARLVKGTRLADPAYRRRLWEGGRAAVDAASRDDAMIALAMRVDPDARAVRKTFEDEVEAVVRRASEALTRARFELEGTGTAPDATFSPRLSYGAVRGWDEEGRAVAPFTTLRGAFERHTGRPPFALPSRWLEARGRLDPSRPLDFVTTNDIIGGNSGSPVVDARAELVGLVFDGNIHSLGGEYGFDAATNRAVAVHAGAILEALSTVYRAEALLKELRAGAPGAATR
ncbi:MAG TPA: S46 family peptidase [Anaeromyxobacteraceae bacterium]|nr:S46 family peptidase [Anaeromyxobacteraceae bacterium]